MTPTPGDWQFDAGDSGDSDVGIGAAPATIFVETPSDSASGETVTLATLHEPCYQSTADEEEPPYGYRWLGDRAANGRLMAAAKDLLAVAREYVRQCEDTFIDPEEMTEECVVLWKQSKAAIAKATTPTT